MIKRNFILLFSISFVALITFGAIKSTPLAATLSRVEPTYTDIVPTVVPASPTFTHSPIPLGIPANTLVPANSAIPTRTQTPLPMVVPLIIREPTLVSFGPYNFPSVVNPLTGLPIEQFSLLDRRPIVVKITNYPRSVRPQSGLSRADIVYEYYLESGISRFIAIFYGQEADKVGPVRSGRFFDEHIFRMYDGIFVFANADKRVMDYFRGLEDYITNSLIIEPFRFEPVNCGPDTYEYFCRDENIKIHSYNNLFTNTAALTDYINRRIGNHRPNLDGTVFSYQTPPNGELGLNVYTRYSLFIYNRWEYSVELGRYLRYQETIGYADPNRESYAPLIDDLTGEQLAADNVVVITVPHEYYIKTRTTEIYKIHLLGQGNGYVFRDGFVFPIIWSRPDDGGVLNLFTLDGEYFSLKPGNTWYQVISEESILSRVNGVDWRFTFVPPFVPDDPINPEAAIFSFP